MRIEKITVKNFRLLQEISITLDKKTTVIVGRNNSGKTSLTELFRRIVADTAPKFTLDDFNSTVHNDLWEAFRLLRENHEEQEIRNKLPTIEIQLILSYDDSTEDEDLGVLSEFIIDLDPSIKQVIAVMKYRLKDGAIEGLFQGLEFSKTSESDKQKSTFFRIINERITHYYTAELLTIDPTDQNNFKSVELSKFRMLFQAGFINAQRGLDDTTHKEKDVLGKILGALFSVTQQDNASEGDKENSRKLNQIVAEMQDKVDTSFNEQLTQILPVLSMFGYPGLADPQLQTVTTLDTQRLLDTHTKIRYKGINSNSLPETYNGLGSRNLIYILFSLYEFFKSYQTRQTAPGIHVIFIEEPEAHLHPQMQEVFIHQLSNIASEFSTRLNGGITWPVQFVVTTHSTHMANKASFDTIRYFLRASTEVSNTIIKDLSDGFNGKDIYEDKEFLHKYLTLTKCDLFFADKAILIEGPTERILMPKIIEKVDETLSDETKLARQYLSVVEVGGAYAHHFYKFLDFLELKTLIITDLDSTKEQTKNGSKRYSACKVSEGTNTSNECIKKWYDGPKPISLQEIMAATESDKICGYRRIAYQIPEQAEAACGRSFEDSFMLANPTLFQLTGDEEEKGKQAWEKAGDVIKTDFALKHAIDTTDWNVPLYIKEGLVWLSINNNRVSTNSNEIENTMSGVQNA
ncbi:MAG: AAA family ATPase [Ignavibacteria bacterium]|nr:AAA family ATPase [Ignavibacteria bacterium]